MAQQITNTGWTKLSGAVSELQINVSNDSKTNWYIAIPASLGITKATSGGITDENITGSLRHVTSKDGVDYVVFTLEDARKFNYLMK